MAQIKRVVTVKHWHIIMVDRYTFCDIWVSTGRKLSTGR